MITSELRNIVLELIDNRITTKDLEDWLVPRLPLFLSSPDSADADVVSAIELCLAEIDAGIKTEEVFREFMVKVLQEQTAVLTLWSTNANQVIPVTGINESSSTNQTMPFSPIYKSDRSIVYSSSIVGN